MTGARLFAATLALALAVAARAEDVPPPAPAPEEPPLYALHDLHLEVDKSDRELRVYLSGQRVATYRVAVGAPEFPTPSGQFAITQIDWNPDWRPPKSPWAKKAKYTPPGSKDNPLGRVRMSFDGPHAVHGTRATGSLGRAASHGCVRMADDLIVKLAPIVMTHGGAPRTKAWVDAALARPTKMRRVRLPKPVPLEVHE